MLLTRKASTVAAPHRPLEPHRRGASGQDDRPPHVPQALGSRGRRGRGASASCRSHDGQGQSRREGPGRQDRSQAHGLHALLGRLRDRRGGGERRLDTPGAGVRLADQPRRALRQGRVDPRARHDARLAPPEVPDEARRRQMEAHHLGRGARTKSATKLLADQQGKRARCDCSGSAPPSTTTSRPRLLRKFVSLLRHQQHGPPGAHLPLDHGGRRRRTPGAMAR